ncbi:YchJ family metal-binding protein [Nevskia sp.]|uniref:YchJ family protein n=1 Tax=Nevskia sp. TaxID=1929292 RepID=UPI0025F370E5|nr:YchJ family metal-binding protein [Nevskia sp.]
MAIDDSEACPCGSGIRYGGCCGRLHDGFAADSAVALMRSRYSAYVRGREDYLRETWHPRTRPDALDLDAKPATKWLGLSIREHRQTGEDTAIVEFVARYKVGGGTAVRLHEVSRFLREGGRWFYVDGEMR